MEKMNDQNNKLHPLQKLDGHMNTWTGKKFSILDPKPDQIDIRDIARGLANTCHFGGQVESFFSVAQHSVMVYRMVKLSDPDTQLAKVALLHDAAEAYVGDVIKPLKVLLPEYNKIERNIQQAIFEKFDLDIDHLPLIKPADIHIQSQEFDCFYKKKGKLSFCGPSLAYTIFLDCCSDEKLYKKP